MEHFVIIVNGFQPLTIITQSSILDVAAVLDPPLQMQLTSRNNYVVLKSFKNKLNEIERVLALISFFTALEVKKSMRMIATTLKLLTELK